MITRMVLLALCVMPFGNLVGGVCCVGIGCFVGRERIQWHSFDDFAVVSFFTFSVRWQFSHSSSLFSFGMAAYGSLGGGRIVDMAGRGAWAVGLARSWAERGQKPFRGHSCRYFSHPLAYVRKTP